MTLEGYLERKNRLLRSIRSKESKIRFFQDKAVNCTVGYSETSGSTSSRNIHPMEDAIAETDALRKEVMSEKEELSELDAAFLGELREMDNPTLAVVLELKYVQGSTWQGISQATGYSVRQLYRFQKEAIEWLRGKDKCHA